MEALCSNTYTTCTPDECRAQLRSQAALQNYFKYTHFRPGQLDAILPVQHGKDVFVQMATGSGKTLCMFIPVLAAHEEAMGIIVSPLSGLIDQQVLATSFLNMHIILFMYVIKYILLLLFV